SSSTPPPAPGCSRATPARARRPAPRRRTTPTGSTRCCGVVAPSDGQLPSPAVATDPPADLQLTPINGEPQPLDHWLTTFQLALVVLDPFTNESSWLLDTSTRTLGHFNGADCRTSLLLTSTADEARQFLGPWADRFLTFADPDRAAVKALGLNELPAFIQM